MRRMTALLLAVVYIFAFSFTAYAEKAPENTLKETLQCEAAYEYLLSQSPGSYSIVVSSILGEPVPQRAEAELEQRISKLKSDHFEPATDLERLIIDLVKTGKDPRNYSRTDFIEQLCNLENLYKQGVNAPVFALLAMNSGQFASPENSLYTTFDFVDYLLAAQRVDGSFALNKDMKSDVDVTAYAIIALSQYRDEKFVESLILKAIDWLAEQQNPDGTFSSMKVPSAESTASVIMALKLSGVAQDDPRFIKDGVSVYQALELFNTGRGYSHEIDTEANVLATEHAIMAKYVMAYGITPFSATPEYHETLENASPLAPFLQFAGMFFGAFAVIYLILVVTKMIGQKYGKKDAPEFSNPYVAPEDEPPIDAMDAAEMEKTREIDLSEYKNKENQPPEA